MRIEIKGRVSKIELAHGTDQAQTVMVSIDKHAAVVSQPQEGSSSRVNTRVEIATGWLSLTTGKTGAYGKDALPLQVGQEVVLTVDVYVARVEQERSAGERETVSPAFQGLRAGEPIPAVTR